MSVLVLPAKKDCKRLEPLITPLLNSVSSLNYSLFKDVGITFEYANTPLAHSGKKCSSISHKHCTNVSTATQVRHSMSHGRWQCSTPSSLPCQLFSWEFLKRTSLHLHYLLFLNYTKRVKRMVVSIYESIWVGCSWPLLKQSPYSSACSVSSAKLSLQ